MRLQSTKGTPTRFLPLGARLRPLRPEIPDVVDDLFPKAAVAARRRRGPLLLERNRGDRVRVPDRVQPSRPDQLLVQRAGWSREDAVGGRAEERGFPVHRAAARDREVGGRQQRQAVQRAVGDQYVGGAGGIGHLLAASRRSHTPRTPLPSPIRRATASRIASLAAS